MTRDSAGNGTEKNWHKQITGVFFSSFSPLIFLIILIDQQWVTKVAAITLSPTRKKISITFLVAFFLWPLLAFSQLADLFAFSGQVGTQLRFLSLSDRHFHDALRSKCAHYNASAGAQVRCLWPELAPVHVRVQSFVVCWGMRSDNSIATRQTKPNLQGLPGQ